MCKDCILNIVAFLQVIRSPADGSVVSYIVILLCSSNEE